MYFFEVLLAAFTARDPGLVLTNTASKPLPFKLRMAWAAPGSKLIWPGSESQFTSR